MTKMHREIIWLIIYHGDFCEHVGLLSENSHASADTLITSMFVKHTHTHIHTCMRTHARIQNCDGDGKNGNKNMAFLLCRLQIQF